jgi:DNA (cytosine-5)-methyltransferase 1
MKHGSLFSGIGGFDLAAEWAGWENVFHCEWNPFGQRVLKHYWPNAESFFDINTSDFSKYANGLDILTGGFPCQPFSSTGKRRGTDDPRHLWPRMLEVISTIKPRWVVGENVHGLVNWSNGMVFQEVHTDLEAQGYTVQSFLLPAAGVGAIHKRNRIWFVAYANGIGLPKMGKRHGQKRRISEKSSSEFDRHFAAQWDKKKRSSGVICSDDGLPKGLDGITLSKWRDESIKAYGNAIVPQVAYEIFNAINEYERLYR